MEIKLIDLTYLLSMGLTIPISIQQSSKTVEVYIYLLVCLLYLMLIFVCTIILLNVILLYLIKHLSIKVLE